jgi:NADH-quinone oxidoreductase subunit H
MSFDWMKIPYALLTVFIVFNYGMLLGALIQKIGARAGRRYGIPIWQNYVDLIKNYGQRTSITHGVMFYLGPVFRLTGGVGLLLFVPTIYGCYMFSNLSFAGDLILALYFVFFGTLGMAWAPARAAIRTRRSASPAACRRSASPNCRSRWRCSRWRCNTRRCRSPTSSPRSRAA